VPPHMCGAKHGADYASAAQQKNHGALPHHQTQLHEQCTFGIETALDQCSLEPGQSSATTWHNFDVEAPATFRDQDVCDKLKEMCLRYVFQRRQRTPAADRAVREATGELTGIQYTHTHKHTRTHTHTNKHTHTHTYLRACMYAPWATNRSFFVHARIHKYMHMSTYT
jgi:hypothetical protein